MVRGLLGTRLHSRRWVVGKQVKLHLYLELLPITRITAWAPPPVRSAAALDSHRSANPTVNCTCERYRLRQCGGSLQICSWLKLQIIISREVWLHKDHNKSIACRLISKHYQWGFLGGAVVKNPPANAGDTDSSPGPGRSHMPQSN